MNTEICKRRVRWSLLLAAVACFPLLARSDRIHAVGGESALSGPDKSGHDERAPAAAALEAASRIVESSGSSGGICSVVGPADAELGLAIAREGGFVVQCLADDSQLCDRLRTEIRSQGMYGPVSADTLRGERLPYTDNLLNIVVVDTYPALAKHGLTADDVLRALAPLGTAYFGNSAEGGSDRWIAELTAKLRSSAIKDVSVVEAAGSWVRVKKPWPTGIDEWTHYLHGPDGNPVAQDLVVGPPVHYQWISEPLWQRSHETDSSISTLVTARGRLFAIIDEAPISVAGMHPLPDKWFLEARDAFNGVPLWKVPIRRWGWREWKDSWFDTRPGDYPFNLQKRLVAAGDKLYVTLGYRAPVTELDARSGQLLKTYAGTQRTGEILYLDGTLVLSVQGDERLKVMAVDAESGKQLWVTKNSYRGSTTDYLKFKEMNGGIKPPKLDSSLNMATDGTAVALIDGPEIVALDFQTGRERWRAQFPQDEADQTAGGIQSQGNLWIGTMIVHDGVVLHASPSRLAAFSVASGEQLWAQPKKYIGHLWYEWKEVFVIGGLVWTWGDEFEQHEFDLGPRKKQRTNAPTSVKGYDLKTGELKREVPLGSVFVANHHHRCYRDKATVRYILASRRGSEFIDLVDGRHSVNNWVRGTCHLGMMPANGLQYAPPHPCACYINEKLSGMNALAPERKGEGGRGKGEGTPRLERGPVYKEQGTGDRGQGTGLSTLNPQPSTFNPQPSTLNPTSAWPAFRHDGMRTGSVETTVPDDAAAAWRVSVGRKVSPPTVVGQRLFAALVDEHHVICLDVQNGSKLWEFAAGARIDSPPTYHEGTVLFGSADGYVYCLRAADGQLIWRFRAAPEDRQIGAFGQLESAWPVHGSVLVQNGTVYFAAGRSSELDGGIYLYGLDAATGQPRYETNLEGPHYGVGDFEVNFKLPMGSLTDILMGDGSNIYMHTDAFDAELNRKRATPDLQTTHGFLDDTYFKRIPWKFDGNYARLIVKDKRSVYYVRMFDTLRGLDPTVYFTPGSKGYLLFAKNVQGKADTWTARIPVRIRAMVLTPERLLVTGPPDVLDPADPLGAFEGRKGGVLAVIDSATGQEVAKHELPSPPVFNGAAAAAGRLYIAEEDGTITCFAKP